jgi:hypothetical protein
MEDLAVDRVVKVELCFTAFSSVLNSNERGSVIINVTLRRVRVTTATVEKQ